MAVQLTYPNYEMIQLKQLPISIEVFQCLKIKRAKDKNEVV